MLLSLSSFSKTVEEDRKYIALFKAECENNKQFLVKNSFEVECLNMYQHYNSQSYQSYSETLAVKQKKVRIGGFNLWHPGSQNSGYKDYKLVAKIMNEWDVISATELLPLVSLDLKNNKLVLGVLENGPSDLRALKKKLRLANQNGDINLVKGLTKQIKALTTTLKKAPNLYRSPGYLKVLKELRLLDSSWSLLLSPRGDSAKPTNVKELTGFFYRGRIVKPIANEHCQETYKRERGKKISCFPNLRKSFMGRETSHVFSRRPLLASFKSGKFDFTLLTSHVVFTSPHPVEHKEDMVRILKASFGVEHYKKLGVGLDSTNYARFAESKIILELISNLKKKYKEKDVVYVGDMNLETDNPFWSDLLKTHGDHQLLIEEKTSLSQAKYNSRGDATKARASNYDHFVIPKNSFSNCQKINGDYDLRTLRYLKGHVLDYMNETYIVRSKSLKDNFLEEEEDYEVENESLIDDYTMTRTGQKKMQKKIKELEIKLNKIYTIKKGVVVKDNAKISLRLNYFKERVFMSQLRNRTFYRVYKEIISDHYPIKMTCSNN